MKKKQLIVSNSLSSFLLLIILCLSSISIQGCEMEKDAFLTDISEIPRPSGEDRINITVVISKHIPQGTELQQALSFLEGRGFKITSNASKNIPSGQMQFLAEREKRHKIIFAERTRIIIESDGFKVKEIRGWVYLIGI